MVTGRVSVSREESPLVRTSRFRTILVVEHDSFKAESFIQHVSFNAHQYVKNVKEHC